MKKDKAQSAQCDRQMRQHPTRQEWIHDEKGNDSCGTMRSSLVEEGGLRITPQLSEENAEGQAAQDDSRKKKEEADSSHNNLQWMETAQMHQQDIDSAIA